MATLAATPAWDELANHRGMLLAAAAFGVVQMRDLVRAALFLELTFLGIAGMFVLLYAGLPVAFALMSAAALGIASIKGSAPGRMWACPCPARARPVPGPCPASKGL